ncbi:MAG: hypothetical protein AAFO94_11155, partial [Bacteroidota bacterium]
MKNLIVLIICICSLSVAAQETQSNIERKGFVIGLSLGGSAISISESISDANFDDAQGGLSLPNLKFGWMLNERLALMATFPGMIYEYEGTDRSFDAFVPSLQYWMGNRWWINGGVGLAMDFPALYEVDNVRDEEWNFGCAVAISTGYELVQRGKFALDLQTKLYLGRVSLGDKQYRDAAIFSVGVG